MLKNKLQAIVLAAGRSTRFNSGRTKLSERICGQEMILYATTLLQKINIPTTIVTGYAREVVESIIKKRHGSEINFVVQEEQNGTGHALLCTKSIWNNDAILIINGDMPLITEDIIEQLSQKHFETNADITFVTAHNSDPSLQGYGRVVQEDHKIRIIEPKEFHGDTHEHCCINAGIYIFNKNFLVHSIEKIERSSATNEFYLTDLIKIASETDHVIKTLTVPFDTVRGVNDFKELWTVEQIKRSEIISHWMSRGVRFYSAQSVHIDLDATIGIGSYIGAGVHIINGSHVGSNCHIEAFSIISNSTIGDGVSVFANSIVSDSLVEESCQIGPFAHIEANSVIKQNVVIGNFVQVKKSTVGPKTKAKHLSFIGNAQVGANVNIGAGLVTCNYDGVNKYTTTIEDNTFIGSNNTLVAPVTLQKNSYTAAGSVITSNVPEGALAIARSRQINKEGYAQKIKQKESPFLAAIKTNTNHIEGI